MKRSLVLSFCGLFLAGALEAGVVEKSILYRQGLTVLEGFFAMPDDAVGPVPGVVVVHDWMGLSDVTRDSARRLAALGFAAFAADIYGKGVRPADTKGAMAESGKYKGDRRLLRARAKAALETLKKQKGVDASRCAAIGYCFGGAAVLEMARGQMPVKGVVSFHGSLDTPVPAKKITAKVLVLHGADDPFAPAEQVAALEKELKDAGADYQVVLYGGARHAFTNPQATGEPPMEGAKYDEKADRRSWKAMADFLDELFGGKP